MPNLNTIEELLNAGRYHDCLNLLESSDDTDFVKNATFLNIAGICFVGLDDLISAEAKFTESVNLHGHYLKARKNLINVQFDLGKFQCAIDNCYHEDIDVDESLKLVFQGLRRNAKNTLPEKVIFHLSDCLTRHSDLIERSLLFREIAFVYLSTGNQLEAQNSFEKAHQCDPESKELIELYGCSLAQGGKYEESLRVLSLNGDFSEFKAETIAAMLRCMRKLHRIQDALHLLESFEIHKIVSNVAFSIEVCTVLIIDLQEPRALSLLENVSSKNKEDAFLIAYTKARALRGLNRYRESLVAVTQSLNLKPKAVQALNLRGILCQDLGKFNEAFSYFSKALAFKPGPEEKAQLFRQLSEIAPERAVDELTHLGLSALEGATGSNYVASVCLYGLANLYHRKNKYEQAYRCYIEGGLRRQVANRYSFDYEREMFRKIKTSADGILDLQADPTQIGFVPIFVFGMPRSGTSIITQVLCSHSKIGTVGETNAVAKFGNDLCFGLEQPSQSAISQIRRNIANTMPERLSNTSRFVVEKMPKNFLYLHLLKSAFPEAVFIHVERDPQATIWSNFIQYFPARGLDYSFSIKDTIDFFCLYRELITYWASRDITFFNLSYSKLIDDPESQIRCLFDHIGLSAESQCFSPEQNNTIVKTASNTQVRSAISPGADAKWMIYRDYLPQEFISFI